MNLRRTICAFAALACAVPAVQLIQVADADAARRTGLAGSPLITDHDDVYFFPQSILGQQLYLDIDVYPTAGLAGVGGSAGLVLGNESLAFGIFTGRFDTSGALGFAGLGISDGMLPAGGVNTGLLQTLGADPVQWVDLVFASGTADQGFGLRLSLGGSFSRDESEASFEDGFINRQSTFLMDVVAGYTLSGASSRTELSAELGFGTASVSSENKDTGEVGAHQNSLMLPAVSLLARQTLVQDTTLDFVLMGGMSFGTARHNQFTGENDALNIDDELADSQRDSNFGLFAAGGPVYHVSQRATLSADLGIGYFRSSNDPHVDSELDIIDSDALDNDLTIQQTFLVPAIRIAGEFHVSDRLTLRTGARSTHTIDATIIQNEAALFPNPIDADDAVPGDGDDISTRQTGFNYFWTAGFGYAWREFTIDATFNTSFLTNGPYFLSGAASTPWVGILSMRYEFGANHDGGGAAVPVPAP